MLNTLRDHFTCYCLREPVPWWYKPLNCKVKKLLMFWRSVICRFSNKRGNSVVFNPFHILDMAPLLSVISYLFMRMFAHESKYHIRHMTTKNIISKATEYKQIHIYSINSSQCGQPSLLSFWEPAAVICPRSATAPLVRSAALVGSKVWLMVVVPV